MKRESPSRGVTRTVLRDGSGAAAPCLRGRGRRIARYGLFLLAAAVTLAVGVDAGGAYCCDTGPAPGRVRRGAPAACYVPKPALRGGGGRPPVGPARGGPGGSQVGRTRLRLRGVIDVGAAEVPAGTKAEVYRVFERTRVAALVMPWSNAPLGSAKVMAGGRFAIELQAPAVRALEDELEQAEAPVGLLVVASDARGPVSAVGVATGDRSDVSGRLVLPQSPVDIRMAAIELGAVACRVVDPDGRPIAGATCVLCDDLPCYWPDGRMVEAVTDAAGLARIRTYAPGASLSLLGSKSWHVYADGLAELHSLPFNVAPGALDAGPQPRTLQLAAAHSPMVLRLQDERGEPVPAGYQATIEARGPGPAACRMGFSSGSPLLVEEGGRVALDGLPAGVERLGIRVPGHESRDVAVDGLERGEPVRLPRWPGALRVCVVDLAGASRGILEVRATPARGSPGIAFARTWTGRPGAVELQPHSAGRFHVRIRVAGVEEWLVTDVELVAGRTAAILLRR